MNGKVYSGQCFCGSVQFTVTGTPAAMGYCHCASCRQWSAGPLNAFSLWKPEALAITRGEEQIRTFEKSPSSRRKWCAQCGGHLFTEHPGLGLTDVYAALLPGLVFEPGVHVNYRESVLHMHDGLPKLRDFPAEFGGSGETMPD